MPDFVGKEALLSLRSGVDEEVGGRGEGGGEGSGKKRERRN